MLGNTLDYQKYDDSLFELLMTSGIVGIVLDGIEIDKGPMRSSNLEERWTLMLSKIPFLPFDSKKRMLP